MTVHLDVVLVHSVSSSWSSKVPNPSGDLRETPRPAKTVIQAKVTKPRSASGQQWLAAALGGKWVSGFNGIFTVDLVRMPDFMAWQPRKLFELSGPHYPALESGWEKEPSPTPNLLQNRHRNLCLCQNLRNIIG